MAHAALVPALSLIAGIVLGVWGSLPAWLGVGWLVAACAASAWAYFARRPRLLIACVVVGWAAAGLVLGSRADAAARDPPIRRLLPADGDTPVVLTGTLVQDAAWSPTGVSLTLRAREWRRDGQVVGVDDGVVVTVGGDPDAARVEAWTAGRLVRLPAWLRVPTRYLDDGVPDHRLALARRGIALVGSVKSGALVEVIAPGTRLDEAAARTRAAVRRLVAASIGTRSPRAGAVVTAILIGDRGGLDPDVERQMQEAGTYHVIAISGGNIAILAGCLLFAARLLALPWRAGLAATAVVLLAYAPLAGGGSSVLRAIVMAVVYLVGRAIDQQASAASVLAVAATLLLVVSPLALADPAFLLTFGATIAIVSMVPGATRSVGGPLVVRAGAALLAASAATEIALLPIGATFFERVTFAGLLLNFLAIPLMSVVEIGGMAVVALQAIRPSVAGHVAWVPQLAADWLIESAGLVRWWPWATWRVPPPPLWVSGLYYVALTAWLTRRWWLPRLASRHAVVSRTVVAVLVLAGLHVVTAPGPLPIGRARHLLRVTMIDVGQGDATLVRLPDGRALLVDAGGLGGGARFDIGERVVAPAVWALGVRQLDTLVATHGDVDHVGGAAAVTAMLRPRDVWEGVPVTGDPELAALVAAAARARIPWRTVQAGDVWRDGQAIVTVVHPPLPEWERRRVRNNDSVVLEIRYGDVSLVLTGDAGQEVEPEIASRLGPARLRVLKVGHHGSATSTSAAFLAAIHPAVAVVSCGRQNHFGHPSPAVLRRLFASGAAVFRTDRDGAVTLETDGHTLTVRTYTGEEAVFTAAPGGSPSKSTGDSSRTPNDVMERARPNMRTLQGAVTTWLRQTWRR